MLGNDENKSKKLNKIINLYEVKENCLNIFCLEVVIGEILTKKKL